MDPLLIDKLKFDLRVYVIITGFNEGDIKAYLVNEGFARLY